MAIKEKVKQGKHLTVTTRADGSVELNWDWDKLLEEVQAATAGGIKGVSASPYKGKRVSEVLSDAAVNDLVKETETKVKKTRAKAVVNDQITDAVTAKKPAAKKKTPATKKPTK